MFPLIKIERFFILQNKLTCNKIIIAGLQSKLFFDNNDFGFKIVLI